MSKFLQKLYERQVVGKTVVIGKQSTPNFPKKKNISYPLTILRHLFFGKFGVLYFVVTTVLRFAIFCLITDEVIRKGVNSEVKIYHPYPLAHHAVNM